jgi:DNA-binding NarL/FixJ family response regulator
MEGGSVNALPRHRPFSQKGTPLLLLESDPWRESSLVAFLRAEGYDVRLTDAGESPPQLALIDFRSGGGETRSQYETLRGKYPEMKTVAFVSDVNAGTVFPCFLLGIKGVLPAIAGGDEVLLALAAVREGSVWTPRAVLSQWIDRIASLGLDGVGRAFSRAEQRVLDGLREELSNKEIARRLGIAEATVKFHVGRLLKKTGTRDRRELTRFVVESAPTLWPADSRLSNDTKG